MAAFFERVFEVVHETLFFAVFHFEVGNGRLQAGRPVDQIFILVDEAQAIHAHERFAHGAGQPFIQGKAFAIPITGSAQMAQLLGDVAAVFVLSIPRCVR